MAKVICDITISADGYSAGLDQTEERPFGDDGGDGSGDKLHAWMFDTPEENQAEIDQFAAAKAFIMGRNMFGPVRGEWDRPWNGWWGEDPPFHAPVFVLTHYARDPQPMDGGTTYYFVTDGIEPALAQARAAAGNGDVVIAGGDHDHHQPVPRRRPDRRGAAAHCAAHARRRNAAVRGRPAAETRAGEVASGELGYARDLPCAVLSRRAVARYADGCSVFDIPDGGKTVRHKFAMLRALCDDLGRPYDQIEKVIATRLQPGESTASFVIRCVTFADLGIDHASVITTGPWTAEGAAPLSRPHIRSSAPLLPPNRPGPGAIPVKGRRVCMCASSV